MQPDIEFSPHDGAIHIQGCALQVVGGVSCDVLLPALSPPLTPLPPCDHGNGYSWLSYQGARLGGHPCGLSFGLYRDRLQQVHFGVALPGAKTEEGWPTREAIDAEITFVRRILAEAFARRFATGEERFPWGTVWSVFDPKGFQASSGLRYGG